VNYFSSVIISAELLANIEVCGMMEVELAHDCCNLLHFVDHSAATSQELLSNEMEVNYEDSDGDDGNYEPVDDGQVHDNDSLSASTKRHSYAGKK